MGYMSEQEGLVKYEVDIRDRRTGNSIETIWSGTDHDVAFDKADSWNIEHGFGEVGVDYMSYDELLIFSSLLTKKEPDNIYNPNEKYFADVYIVED